MTAAIKQVKPEGEHRYGCLLMRLPADIAKEITDWSIENIPDFCLGPGGRELASHLTIKYGLEEDDPEVVAALKALLLRAGPVRLLLSRLALFRGNEDGDVLYAEVVSPQAEELNAQITAGFACHDKYPEYVPHVAIAYLDPQFSGSHESATAPFLGRELTLTEAEFSTPEGEVMPLPLAFSGFFGNGKALSSVEQTMTMADAEADGNGHGQFLCHCGRMIRQCRCRITPENPHRVYHIVDQTCESCGGFFGSGKSLEPGKTVAWVSGRQTVMGEVLEDTGDRLVVRITSVDRKGSIKEGDKLSVLKGAVQEMKALLGNKAGESYFSECERDEGGHCLPSGETGAGKEPEQDRRQLKEITEGLEVKPQKYVLSRLSLSSPARAKKEFITALDKQYPKDVPIFHEAPITALESIKTNGIMAGESGEAVWGTVGKPSGFVTADSKVIVRFDVKSFQKKIRQSIRPDSMRYDAGDKDEYQAALEEHGGVYGMDVAVDSLQIRPSQIHSITVVKGGEATTFMYSYANSSWVSTKNEDGKHVETLHSKVATERKTLSWINPLAGGALVEPPQTGLRAVRRKYRVKEQRGPEGEHCPHCDARLERDPDAGTCNRCGEFWPETKSLPRFRSKSQGGSCKPGERSDLTGCVPATADPKADKPAEKDTPTDTPATPATPPPKTATERMGRTSDAFNSEVDSLHRRVRAGEITPEQAQTIATAAGEKAVKRATTLAATNYQELKTFALEKFGDTPETHAALDVARDTMRDARDEYARMVAFRRDNAADQADRATRDDHRDVVRKEGYSLAYTVSVKAWRKLVDTLRGQSPRKAVKALGAAGTCESGERADLTGYVPANRAGGRGTEKAPGPARQAVIRAVLATASRGASLQQGARAAAGRVGQAAWAKLSPGAKDKLARTFQLVKAVEHKVMLGFRKANELAVASAQERGLDEQRTVILARVLAITDTALAWTVNMPAAYAVTGSTGVAKAASWIPVASLGYLAYSTARNPLATLRAAKKLARGATATEHKGLDQATLKQLAGELADRLRDATDLDWYWAVYAAALDETGNPAAALQLADRLTHTQKSLLGYRTKAEGGS